MQPPIKITLPPGNPVRSVLITVNMLFSGLAGIALLVCNFYYAVKYTILISEETTTNECKPYHDWMLVVSIILYISYAYIIVTYRFIGRLHYIPMLISIIYGVAMTPYGIYLLWKGPKDCVEYIGLFQEGISMTVMIHIIFAYSYLFFITGNLNLVVDFEEEKKPEPQITRLTEAIERANLSARTALAQV